MSKVKIFIFILTPLLLIVLAVYIFSRSKTSQQSPSVSQTVQEVVDIPLEQRPYLELIPRQDGKEITLKLTKYTTSSKVEYELSYESQGIPRGVIGESVLDTSTLTKDLLLGTCSRNVCRYDEGVSSGEVVLKFRQAEKVKKFNSQFLLQQSDKELKSPDNKFYLKGKFSKTFYIVAPTIGLPEVVAGQIVEGPYGIFTSGASSLKDSRIIFAGQSDAALQVFNWTGSSWIELTCKVTDDGIEANVDKIGTFVLVR